MDLRARPLLPRAAAASQGLLTTIPALCTEAVWTLGENRSVYAVQDPERAGHGLVTVFVDDLDGWLDRIAGRGLQPDGRETYANGVRKATFRDPDGNEVGFGGAPVDDAAAAE